MALYYSFMKYNGVAKPVWNDFANYKYVVKDPVLKGAIINTLKIAATNAVVVIPISFILAFALAKTSRRNTVYKAILFLPYIIPGSISGLIWFFMLEPSAGLLNSALRAIGLSSLCQEWFGTAQWTPISIGIIAAWGGVGYYMLLWQLGIKNIQDDILEASLIDGCNKRQQIWYVVLPLIKGTLTNIMIFVLTGALQSYETVYILTGGGPNNTTDTIISYMYDTTFMKSRYGYGMTIGMVEFILAMGVALVSLYFGNRKKVEL